VSTRSIVPTSSISPVNTPLRCVHGHEIAPESPAREYLEPPRLLEGRRLEVPERRHGSRTQQYRRLKDNQPVHEPRGDERGGELPSPFHQEAADFGSAKRHQRLRQ